MPRHLISDAHEWINEIPTVPIYYLAKPQPRERAWQNQRGKKTLDSMGLIALLLVGLFGRRDNLERGSLQAENAHGDPVVSCKATVTRGKVSGYGVLWRKVSWGPNASGRKCLEEDGYRVHNSIWNQRRSGGQEVSFQA